MAGKSGFNKGKLKKLLSWSKDKKIAIMVKDDPSADSLVAASAFKTIADHFRVASDVFYRGDIKNQLLFNLIVDELRLLHTPAELEEYELVLIGAVPSEMIYLPHEPVGIISNYKGDLGGISSQYMDIRPDVTAVSSILVEYLPKLDIEIDEQQATQLFFAIRDATLGLKDDLTEYDLEMYYKISTLVNYDILVKLEHPTVKMETFDDLIMAVNKKIVKEAHLVTTIGQKKDATTLSKVCDYLLDLEGILTVLVFVITENTIPIYAKSKDIKVNMRNILEKAFGEWGNVHGTPSYAWMDAPLGVFKTILKGEEEDEQLKLLVSSISDVLARKYFSTLEEGGA